jgi:hypothetical protein
MNDAADTITFLSLKRRISAKKDTASPANREASDESFREA